METVSLQIAIPAAKSHWWSNLAVQLLIAIAAAVTLGEVYPALAVSLQPIGELFIKLIRLAIAPVVFLALTSGIAHIGDVGKVGRIGLKTLIYFELVTTLAMVLGMGVALVFKPGEGVSTPPPNSASTDFTSYTKKSEDISFRSVVTGIVPDNAVAPFVRGDLLQIIFFALLFGAALIAMKERAVPILQGLDRLTAVFFGIIRIVMRVAPLGAFGAMSYTVGKFGVGALLALAKLVLCTYATAAVFVFLVLPVISRAFGFSLFRFIRYIRDELLVVFGTSSSESVLPQMMEKLERFGVARPVVGLVLPTGYSFNMDGLALSLPISAAFIAQAYHVPLTGGRLLGLLALMLITSKGVAGVTGAAFVTLATTVAAVGFLPLEGLALVLSVDMLLSMVRAQTNVIGNAVAAVVVAKLEKEFDREKALKEYAREFGVPEVTKL